MREQFFDLRENMLIQLIEIENKFSDEVIKNFNYFSEKIFNGK